VNSIPVAHDLVLASIRGGRRKGEEEKEGVSKRGRWRCVQTQRAGDRVGHRCSAYKQIEDRKGIVEDRRRRGGVRRMVLRCEGEQGRSGDEEKEKEKEKEKEE
jgi:hypothetical protein